MAGCITEDYKGILVGLIDKDTEKVLLSAIVGAIPLCKDVAPVPAAIREAKAGTGR